MFRSYCISKMCYFLIQFIIQICVFFVLFLGGGGGTLWKLTPLSQQSNDLGKPLVCRSTCCPTWVRDTVHDLLHRLDMAWLRYERVPQVILYEFQSMSLIGYDQRCTSMTYMAFNTKCTITLPGNKQTSVLEITKLVYEPKQGRIGKILK